MFGGREASYELEFSVVTRGVGLTRERGWLLRSQPPFPEAPIMSLEPPLPFEFVVSGTAMSSQASSASKETWKTRIRMAAREALPEDHWMLTAPLRSDHLSVSGRAVEIGRAHV